MFILRYFNLSNYVHSFLFFWNIISMDSTYGVLEVIDILILFEIWFDTFLAISAKRLIKIHKHIKEWSPSHEAMSACKFLSNNKSRIRIKCTWKITYLSWPFLKVASIQLVSSEAFESVTAYSILTAKKIYVNTPSVYVWIF